MTVLECELPEEGRTVHADILLLLLLLLLLLFHFRPLLVRDYIGRLT